MFNPRHASDARPMQGFTLIELIMVVLILGLLASVALPTFSGFKSDTIASSTIGLSATIDATSNQFHLKCATTPSCNNNINSGVLSVGGTIFMMHYGWLDAGDNLHTNQIDMALNTQGFNLSLVNSATTRWTHQDTSSTTCYVEYKEAPNSAASPTVHTVTSNC